MKEGIKVRHTKQNSSARSESQKEEGTLEVEWEVGVGRDSGKEFWCQYQRDLEGFTLNHTGALPEKPLEREGHQLLYIQQPFV